MSMTCVCFCVCVCVYVCRFPTAYLVNRTVARVGALAGHDIETLEVVVHGEEGAGGAVHLQPHGVVVRDLVKDAGHQRLRVLFTNGSFTGVNWGGDKGSK